MVSFFMYLYCLLDSVMKVHITVFSDTVHRTVSQYSTELINQDFDIKVNDMQVSIHQTQVKNCFVIYNKAFLFVLLLMISIISIYIYFPISSYLLLITYGIYRSIYVYIDPSCQEDVILAADDDVTVLNKPVQTKYYHATPKSSIEHGRDYDF